MFFLRSWIEEYLDLSDYSNQELSDLITAKSSEVEEFEVITDYFNKKVVAGRIENVRLHPDADKLKIFDVNIGDNKKVQIVSAAPNVVDGVIVPVALEGAKLPGMIVAPRKMRGENSEGMCCGQSELMLETQFSSGLWELDCDETALGKSICQIYPEKFPEEVIIDVKVLPDKIGSVGSHLGLALELAHNIGNNNLLKKKLKRLVDSNFDIIKEIENNIIKKQSSSANFSDNTGYTNSLFLFDINLNPDQKDDQRYFLPKKYLKRMFLTGENINGGLTDLSN